MSKVEKIAVLGGGSWGSTLAAYLSKQGHDVAVWEFDAKVAQKLEKNRVLETLPGFKLPENILVSNHIGEVLRDRDIIFSVTPSHTVRATFSSKDAQKHLKRGATVVSASKGIEDKTFLSMRQIIREVFPEAGDIVILSGPSHAEEVAQNQPVALVAASISQPAANRIKDLMMSETFRVYTSEDPLGVELGGALKNVYAVACGIVDGLKLGDNIKAALMTRGLAEMARLGSVLKCSAMTFFGLSGLGDLIVTCGSQHSRNRRLGQMIGEGASLEEALKKMNMVAEGVKTTQSAYNLAKSKNIELPIIEEMFKVLFENKSPRDSLKDLMTREVGPEMEGIVL